MTPILQSFDMPDPDFSCPSRFATVQPTQALSTLNGEFLNEQARHLASRIRTEAGNSPEDQVRYALQLTLIRSPSAGEIARGVKLLDRLESEQYLDPDQALELYCLLALNLNEFLYLD